MARTLTAEHKAKMHEGRARAAREHAAQGIESWHAYREWLRREREAYGQLQAAREAKDPAAIEQARERYSVVLANLRQPFGPPPRR